MTELQRTGFFREMPHGEPTDPSLADARNAAPSPHEDRIAAYLDAGHVCIAAPGLTHDVLDTGKRIGPPHHRTDGRFVWPGDLAHYVRTYHVRLEGPFIEHMLANGWTVPADVDVAALALPRRPGARADAQAGAPADKPDVAAAFADFFGAARDALSGAHGEELGAQLGAIGRAASRLVESIAPADENRRQRLAAETESLRKTLEDAGTRARTRLSSSLRTLSDWLEKPEAERTAQVQSFLSSVQTRLDEALAQTRRAERAGATGKLKVTTEVPSEIHMTRTFDAPRRRVVQAMTTPALIERWLGSVRATVVSAEVDLRVGGNYRYVLRPREGNEFAFGGVFREISEGRIVQTEAFDGHPGEAEVTTTWVEHDGKTTMTMMIRFASQAVRDAVIATGMAEGAGESYDQLDAVLAGL